MEADALAEASDRSRHTIIKFEVGANVIENGKVMRSALLHEGIAIEDAARARVTNLRRD